MLSIRRKGRRGGPSRFALRLTLRLVRPLAPGLLAAGAAAYFLDGAAGGARRKKAVALISSGVKK